ncbi:hypothetical protein [Aeromonas salmonicida]|uniref:hypothetical protein n=1 Tax=Aeromonas salmonicida TaxID=645 RepID=UPI00259D8CDF|nr:hypothetical protein [Aeromonas salmonicida]MDM5100857.1 hypothetical protein [Aeromonas salmonicida]
MTTYINNNNTLYSFISDSDEPRHILDIVHGVLTLVNKGVPSHSIKIFTDYPQVFYYTQPFFNDINIDRISMMNTILHSEKGYNNVIFIVTGHGRPDGIGASTLSIPPHNLIDTVRNIPDIQCGIVILCQCYAGVFNYINATQHPPVVVIGAANLGPSLSPPINYVLHDKNTPPNPIFPGWQANAFMFFFFRWFDDKFDIDGDGVHTLIDAYKYAGANSNDAISSIKVSTFIRAQQTAIKIHILEDKKSKAGLDNNEQATLDSLQDALENDISIINVNQEAWLLHANKAREIVFN